MGCALVASLALRGLGVRVGAAACSRISFCACGGVLTSDWGPHLAIFKLPIMAC